MGNLLTTEDFLARAREVHGDRYGYEKVKYVSYQDKVCITCKVHGDFMQAAGSHLHGAGCAKCNRTGRPVMWNYEACYEEAKKYKSRVELLKKNYSCYRNAWKYHWLDDYTWLHKPEPKPKPKPGWTYERCVKYAQKCNTRAEFHKRFRTAHHIAVTMGWIDTFKWIKGRGCRRVEYNKEKCREYASECRTRSEFAKKHSVPYKRSLDNGWIDEFFPVDLRTIKRSKT